MPDDAGSDGDLAARGRGQGLVERLSAMASELTGDEKAAAAGPITVTGSRLAEPTPGPAADVGESATPSPRISVVSTASANDKPMIPRGGVAADALSTVRAGYS
jgi:hypothetical protein